MKTDNLFSIDPWPKADDVRIVSHTGHQWYHTPDGDFPRTTQVLKAIGTGTEGLIRWAATTEQAAVLEAAVQELATSGGSVIPDQFGASVKKRLGSVKAHQRQLMKAGDIGTEIHAAIQHYLNTELGQTDAPPPTLSHPAAIAFLSWKNWWEKLGRRVVKVEQPVWDPVLGYAGTIDCLTDSEHPGVLELWDWKSSAGVYDTHHIQAAAYIRAANRWGIVVPGGIVRLPKDTKGSLDVEVHVIGHLYDGRMLTIDELYDCFKAARLLWGNLVGPRT